MLPESPLKCGCTRKADPTKRQKIRVQVYLMDTIHTPLYIEQDDVPTS